MGTRLSFRTYASNGIQVLLTLALPLCGGGSSKGVFDCRRFHGRTAFLAAMRIAPPGKLLDFGY